MPERLEERVAHLETEVEKLKRAAETEAFSQPWWEKIVGTFADSPAYDAAMQLGREYRESLRPSSTDLVDE
ncbi:MAG: hypothetical protein AAFQ89_22110 [Cyanobacteria bacterium J06626_18]